MRRVIAAAGLGIIAGLGLTLALLQSHEGATAPMQQAGRAHAERGGEGVAGELPRFAGRAQPGLRVDVRDSGRRVAGARVEAWRQLPDDATHSVRWVSIGVEVSDGAGAASFPAAHGQYAVRAETSGRAGLASVEVPVADEPAVAVVTLGATRAVAGRVVDRATKAPVASALVTAVGLSKEASSLTQWRFPAETHVTTLADGLGRFLIDVSADVDVELHAQAPGYVHAAGERADSAPPNDAITLELERAAEVEGQVVDAAGRPLTQATVSSEPRESNPVLSDEAGHFALTLAPGASTIHAVSANGLQGLARVMVVEGVRLRGVRVVVAASGDLSGRVVDPAGAGVGGVEVRVLAEPDSAEVAVVQTEASGAFAAVRLPAARYSLFARSGNGARARLVSVEVPLAAPIELRLAPAAGLTGQVVNEAGAPLANARVEVSWAAGLGEPPVHALTDANGHFEWTDLLPGMVTASAALGDSRSEDAEVYLPAGQSASTRLALIRRGRVKGRVLASKPERFFIFPQPSGGGLEWKRGLRTDDQGRFDEALAPGRYALTAMRPLDAPARAVAGVSVEVRAGETTPVDLPDPAEVADDEAFDTGMHPEVGSGLSLEAGPGGLAVSFVMQGCPAAVAGVRVGDLVLRISGDPVTQTLDAFARLNRPRGEAVSMTVRREGQDLELALK